MLVINIEENLFVCPFAPRESHGADLGSGGRRGAGGRLPLRAPGWSASSLSVTRDEQRSATGARALLSAHRGGANDREN